MPNHSVTVICVLCTIMSHAFIACLAPFRTHCAAALVSSRHPFLDVKSLLIRSTVFRLGAYILVGSPQAPLELL